VSVAFDIKHAESMRRIVLSFVASLAIPYLSTLSHKGTIVWQKKVIEKMF
jgi:hypothetical protein